MTRGVVLPMVLLLAEALAVRAAAAPPPASGTLADVAFIAGHWAGGEPDLSEEVWTAPEGDSMLGMWRYVTKGHARIFELLTLTQEGPIVVLRIRHFDPKLVGREDKERAVELPLVAKGPGEAAFEGADYGGKGSVRLTYRRGEGDTLTVLLEKEGKKEEFRFRRKP